MAAPLKPCVGLDYTKATPLQPRSSLALANVDHFVLAAKVQGGVGLPKDRMAQGDGHRAFSEKELPQNHFTPPP